MYNIKHIYDKCSIDPQEKLQEPVDLLKIGGSVASWPCIEDYTCVRGIGLSEMGSMSKHKF